VPKLSEGAPAPSAAAKKKQSRKDLGSKVQAHIRYTNQYGEQVPGVTTVLNVLNKPALVPWANRMGLQGIDTSKYTDEAASIGTLAHYLAVCDMKGEEPDLSDFTGNQIERAQYGFKAFLDWKSEHVIEEPQLVERPLVSEEFGFGGQIDRWCLLDGVPTLIDMKTSSGLWPEHQYQVSAYWKLLKENGYDIKGVRLLRIGRTEDEGWEEHVLTGAQVLRGWKIFTHCLAIYKLRKEAKG
jgi:hypothetical protein